MSVLRLPFLGCLLIFGTISSAHGYSDEYVRGLNTNLIFRNTVGRTLERAGEEFLERPRKNDKYDEDELDEFEYKCQQGEAGVCLELGQLYDQGKLGAEQDRGKAAALIDRGIMLSEQSCEAGDISGCNRLAVIYRDGIGVERDMVKAASFFQRACDRQDVDACQRIAEWYWNGEGILQDSAKALALYQKSCDTDPEDRFCEDEFDIFKEAAAFRQGCDAGDARDCWNLGYIYAHEIVLGNYKDKDKAATYYLKACDGEVAVACNNLGMLYFKGHGFEKDQAKAAVFFQQACDGGNAVACKNLASSYHDGEGVEQDPVKAGSLYQRSCDIEGDNYFCRYELAVVADVPMQALQEEFDAISDLVKQSQFDEALEVLDDLSNRYPGQKVMIFPMQCGIAAEGLDDLTRARGICDQAISLIEKQEEDETTEQLAAMLAKAQAHLSQRSNQ